MNDEEESEKYEEENKNDEEESENYEEESKNDEEESKNDEEESKNDEEEIRESGKFREFTHVRAQAEGDQPMRTPVIVPAADTLILTRLLL